MFSDPQADAVARILGYARRIAVVGLSPHHRRASHGVAAAMQRQGYDIVPVNPNVDEVLGVPAYASLSDVPGRIDLVDVFRREEHLPAIARAAADRGDVRGLWNQLGLRSEEARRIAAEAGMDYVEDRCLKVEIAKAKLDMELPPVA